MTDDDAPAPRRPTPGRPAGPPPPVVPPPVVPPPVVPPPVVPPPVTPPVTPPATPPTAPPVAEPAPGATGEEYGSTVVAVMQVVLGVVSGVVIAVAFTALNSDLWPVAVLLFLVASAAGVLLAPVSVSIERGRVTIGQGRRDRNPQVIYVAEVRDAGLREVTVAQCLGFAGMETDDRTTRLAVRPGTALVLTLYDGARVVVSVKDGPAALRALGTDRSG